MLSSRLRVPASAANLSTSQKKNALRCICTKAYTLDYHLIVRGAAKNSLYSIPGQARLTTAVNVYRITSWLSAVAAAAERHL